MRVVARAVGGWALGRDAVATDPGLGWPRSGLWGRQDSVRVSVSKVTVRVTRDRSVSLVVVVIFNPTLLAL